MFVLISLFVTFVCILLSLIQRKKETFLFVGALVALDLFLFCIFTFIAKKGGVPPYLNRFFFLTDNIRLFLRNRVITFNQLGYLMSVGRFLFPYLFLLFSLYLTHSSLLNKKGLILSISFFPVSSLIFYWPTFFKSMTIGMQKLLIWYSIIWITLYSLAAFIILILDILMIRPGVYQLKYFAINFFGLFLLTIYFLYRTQDAAEVYRFYAYNLPWTMGLSYSKLLISENLSRNLLVLYIILSIVGIISFYFYLNEIYEISKEEVTLKNNDKTAIPATHIFVHGIKNHLLVQQAYVKKIQREFEHGNDEEVTAGIEKLLTSNNELLAHLDELYQAFKSNQILLQKIKIGKILDEAEKRFYQKYPEAPELIFEGSKESLVMADFQLLGEAFSNILINGYEALPEKEKNIKPLKVIVKEGFLKVSISFIDYGSGISKADKKRIFDPFTSHKNSSHNWGMGLYFTKKIIHKHSGWISVESSPLQGTVFKVILPKKR